MSLFSLLPDDCTAHIISLTSPKHACRAATVSMGFKSAANSDAVWERFLPSDYRQKISESDTPALNFPTKKQLYFHLCHSGLLLDEGKLSLRLTKSSGKKCYLISGRKLTIIWGGDERYWTWTSFPGSRFSQVARLLLVWWFDIQARLSCELLSPNTDYAAYLVFKISTHSYNLDCPWHVSIKCGEADSVGIVHIDTIPTGSGPRRSRRDGWQELKLGEFFVRSGDRSDVEIRFFETELGFEKRGLIIEGIEIRPQAQ